MTGKLTNSSMFLVGSYVSSNPLVRVLNLLLLSPDCEYIRLYSKPSDFLFACAASVLLPVLAWSAEAAMARAEELTRHRATIWLEIRRINIINPFCCTFSVWYFRNWYVGYLKWHPWALPKLFSRDVPQESKEK